MSIAASPIERDAYLTDGVRLFRVSDVLGSFFSTMVVLEDCKSLELMTLSAEELALSHVRLVRGTAPELGLQNLEIVANFH